MSSGKQSVEPIITRWDVSTSVARAAAHNVPAAPQLGSREAAYAGSKQGIRVPVRVAFPG